MKHPLLLLCGIAAVTTPAATASAPASAPAPALSAPAAAPLSPAERDKLIGGAFALSREGKDDGARALFATLMERNPDDPVALAAFGDWQLATGRDAEAEATARRMIGLNPDNPAAALLMGRVAVLYGRFEEAETLFGAAVRLAPDRLDAALLHARLLAATGRPRSAAEVLRNAREKAPASALPDLTAAALELTPSLAERVALLRDLSARRPDLAARVAPNLARLEALGPLKLGEGSLAAPSARIIGKAVDGGWLMRATVNGKPVTLLFASGSPGLFLAPGVPERLGLTSTEALRGGDGAPAWLIGELRLDKLTLKAVPALPTSGALPAGVDGVFGFVLLRDFVVRVIAPDAALEILPENTPPQADNNTTPFYFDGGVPLVPALLDGKGPLLMRLDSGAQGPALNRDLLPLLHLEANGALIDAPHSFGFAGLTVEMPQTPALPLREGMTRHFGIIGALNLPPVFEVRASKGYLSYPTLRPVRKPAPASAPRGSAPAAPARKP